MNFIMRAPLRCARASTPPRGSARRGTPGAYGVRKKSFSSVVYGTTSQLSIPLRQAQGHLGLSAKVLAGPTLVSWAEA